MVRRRSQKKKQKKKTDPLSALTEGQLVLSVCCVDPHKTLLMSGENCSLQQYFDKKPENKNRTCEQNSPEMKLTSETFFFFFPTSNNLLFSVVEKKKAIFHQWLHLWRNHISGKAGHVLCARWISIVSIRECIHSKTNDAISYMILHALSSLRKKKSCLSEAGSHSYFTMIWGKYTFSVAAHTFQHVFLVQLHR